MTNHRFLASILSVVIALSATPLAFAQAPTKPASPAPDTTVRTKPVGFPQDAGAHDKDALIEWWYFNAFLKGKTSGKNYAVVGSFFRIGFTPQNKGHYLIYSLTDLDTKKVITTGSVLDKKEVALMKAYLPLMAMRRPNDTSAMQLIAALQKDTLPEPHRQADGETHITTGESRFRIGMDNDKDLFAQQTDDASVWNARLADTAFSVDITYRQPKTTRPPMLVGGKGMTGLGRPDDMFYLSLTHADVMGNLTVGGTSEPVTGTGWIDRQWGRSWVIGDNGWDWFGVHLDDGSDLIVYQVKANETGKVLRSEATLLRADGTQSVDKNVTFTTTGTWTDPQSGIVFPQIFTAALGTLGQTLTFTPVFDAQSIPTLGIGSAFWEGVVDVSGTTRDGKMITGRGYRELVGYKPKQVETPAAKLDGGSGK